MIINHSHVSLFVHLKMYFSFKKYFFNFSLFIDLLCFMELQQPNNPLHGVTLEAILNDLVEYIGWDKLGDLVPIRCFRTNPSVSSSLKFLRKTPWAREKVEDLYIKNFNKIQKTKIHE
jgi:uncharacterized protein (DUF2132 family)